MYASLGLRTHFSRRVHLGKECQDIVSLGNLFCSLFVLLGFFLRIPLLARGGLLVVFVIALVFLALVGTLFGWRRFCIGRDDAATGQLKTILLESLFQLSLPGTCQ